MPKNHLKMDVNGLMDLQTIKKNQGSNIFQKSQVINHSYFKSSSFKINPLNNYTSSLHVSGGDLDFILQQPKNMTTESLIFSIKITENNTAANVVC